MSKRLPYGKMGEATQDGKVGEKWGEADLKRFCV